MTHNKYSKREYKETGMGWFRLQFVHEPKNQVHMKKKTDSATADNILPIVLEVKLTSS